MLLFSGIVPCKQYAITNVDDVITIPRRIPKANWYSFRAHNAPKEIVSTHNRCFTLFAHADASSEVKFMAGWLYGA